MGWDEELWAGTDNQSGFPGDTNFSVQGTPPAPRNYHHPPALPHQSPFSPDRADQWPRVMVVCPFVKRYSTAHHCDGSTRPERRSQRKAPPSSHCAKCTFGWACCCLGWVVFFWVWGAKPPRVFLSNVSAAGQRGGYGVWGLGNGLFCWDGFISAPLSCQK